MLEAKEVAFETQNYLKLRRGPYIIASVMDESVSEEALILKGSFVDLLDPALPIVSEKTLQPNERTLLYDLHWASQHRPVAEVAAAASRVRDEVLSDRQFSFVTRGPEHVRARMRVRLPQEPAQITTLPENLEKESRWDPESGTLWLDFDNQAKDIAFTLAW